MQKVLKYNQASTIGSVGQSRPNGLIKCRAKCVPDERQKLSVNTEKWSEPDLDKANARGARDVPEILSTAADGAGIGVGKECHE
jgi:hypothetical protein